MYRCVIIEHLNFLSQFLTSICDPTAFVTLVPNVLTPHTQVSVTSHQPSVSQPHAGFMAPCQFPDFLFMSVAACSNFLFSSFSFEAFFYDHCLYIFFNYVLHLRRKPSTMDCAVNLCVWCLCVCLSVVCVVCVYVDFSHVERPATGPPFILSS